MTYDVIVVGLGGMGSAAAYRLARRGLRVLGLERFGPVHDRGSSHSGSRVTRLAYFEDPAYVPLLLRSHELWRHVERDSGDTIFDQVGGVMAGAPDSTTVAGSVRSAVEWDLPHEILDADQLRRRFPTMQPADDEIALYEPGAGFVRPEVSVAAHLRLADQAGAELRFEEPVVGWEDGTVLTAVRRYEADQIVVCPGAWAPELLADLGVPFGIERQVQYWFRPARSFDPHPVYIWELDGGRQFYGFPAIGEEVKVAFFRGGQACTPETIDRTVHAEEVDTMAEFVARRMPALPATFVRASTCMYTNTPDHHFVIARHPEQPRVVVACGFSGHGFKFVPVVGEIVADLVVDGATRHPISLFDPRRF